MNAINYYPEQGPSHSMRIRFQHDGRKRDIARILGTMGNAIDLARLDQLTDLEVSRLAESLGRVTR